MSTAHDSVFLMSREPYTTEQAARKVGITRQTLQSWIRAKKIRPPAPTLDGARGKRLWTESDLARLREAKAKVYYKGQGRPRQARKERER
jgi:excisionase family DNA binding protein